MVKVFSLGCLALFSLVLLIGQNALADDKDDIGYTDLSSTFGSSLPQGESVIATHVEAPVDGHWMPDAGNAEFNGKILQDRTGGDSGSSSHATTVGRRFYGITSSIAPGVNQIYNYEAGDWVGLGFLGAGYLLGDDPFQPNFDHTVYPWILSSPSRVANHSWVGTTTGSDPLRRMDFVIETDESIQIVAINNNSTTRGLWSGAFNAIAIGRTNGGYPQPTIFIDATYHADLTRPHLVTPRGTTSDATPLAASASVLLVEAGADPDLSTDPVATCTQDRSGNTINNAQRSEVIKATLMAGASRITHNTSTTDIDDYRSPVNRSDNGLDLRYGAGQLNIDHSYRIITAGEQNSLEDLPSTEGLIADDGFDYDPFFGGSDGSNAVATYHVETASTHRRLFAALVWNIDIEGGEWNHFDNSATLRHMHLELIDDTQPDALLNIAASRSDDENNQNLWVTLLPGHSYQMKVSARENPYLWDYALAWRIQPPADEDSDGMGDDWEVEYGLNPDDPLDASLDIDGDALTTLEEYQNGTDPEASDTDGDGTQDGAEVLAGTNPIDPGDNPEQLSAVTAATILCSMMTLSLIGAVGILRRS